MRILRPNHETKAGSVSDPAFVKEKEMKGFAVYVDLPTM
jgi:hypothetical protein